MLRLLITHFRRPLAVAPSPTRLGGRRPVRPTLALEPLEDRTLLSGTGALGVAGAFNVFVLGQLTQSYTDSEGRVAAGGDVRLSGYGIGSTLTNSGGQRDDLIVGGGLSYNQGQVFNGNIVYGGTAALSNVGLPNGTARQGAPLDFAAARTQLDALSAAYAGLAANGTAADTYGTLRLAGADPTLDVFSVSAGELAVANGLNITAPAGATVLVNVSGTADQMQYFGMTLSGTDRQHVLFNFPDATSPA
jgi:choice-of-anchor A domain-containing protein